MFKTSAASYAKDASGIDVNAGLIPTGTTSVLNKSTEIFSLTVTLGKLSHQGLKEAEVAKLVAGAEIELRKDPTCAARLPAGVPPEQSNI